MIPQENQIYRHFKGDLYRVITIAKHTETMEELVIYQAMYAEDKVYARPLAMFLEEVDKEKYPNAKQKMRFELVEYKSETKEVKEEAEDAEQIDPMLEAYLDSDSYREKLNILHGLQHRITEHMLNTMAIVIDFELPEGDINTKYNALNDCLMTKEKYECNRMV